LSVPRRATSRSNCNRQIPSMPPVLILQRKLAAPKCW
jgi:hypothetical protein